jgi:isopenicillin-N N-acyltransferase like protein
VSRPIPLVRATGSHAAVGASIGRETGEAIRRAVASAPVEAELVDRYRAVTVEHLPWVVEELDAAAAAARIDPRALFAASIEELSSSPAPARCTDLVFTHAATEHGHLLVAHNNDLSAAEEEDVVAIEWAVPGEPVVFSLGIGPWLSVGWNGAGLSVTGNELSPNDERVGIPRLLQMRDVVTRRTLDEAVEAILHPARASSYNWVLAHADSQVLNLEGSATRAGIDEPDGDGRLAHTNHYAREDMRGFERSTGVEGSCRRLERARELGRQGPVSVDALRAALSDHANAPDSLCRHGEGPDGTKTVFWCIADVTAGEILYGRGNPCDSMAQRYRFET